MKKSEIVALLIHRLEENLRTIQSSALAASEAATHPEAKAENKYDTRGLESAYLAAAQNRRASELVESIEQIRALPTQHLPPGSRIVVGAVVKLAVNCDSVKWLILLPASGGLQVEYEDCSLQSLTADSPLGRKMLHKVVGNEFEMQAGGQLNQYEIELVF